MRLSQEKIQKLIKLVLANAYQEKKEALQDKWNALSEKIWLHFYGEYWGIMDSLPKEAFEWQSCLYIRRVNEDGTKQNKVSAIWFSKRRETANETRFRSDKVHKSAVPVYRPKFFNGDFIELPIVHPLLVEYDALRWEQGLIEDDVKAIASELNRLLAAVKTKAALLKAWPAGAKWIEEAFPDPPKNLPAVIETTKINTLLCDAIGEKSPTC